MSGRIADEALSELARLKAQLYYRELKAVIHAARRAAVLRCLEIVRANGGGEDALGDPPSGPEVAQTMVVQIEKLLEEWDDG